MRGPVRFSRSQMSHSRVATLTVSELTGLTVLVRFVTFISIGSSPK
jgi:hypothetical protein